MRILPSQPNEQVGQLFLIESFRYRGSPYVDASRHGLDYLSTKVAVCLYSPPDARPTCVVSVADQCACRSQGSCITVRQQRLLLYKRFCVFLSFLNIMSQ